MNKQITVSFYDCCLPSYFSGQHWPVLQCPVDGETTRRQLCDGLLSELAEGIIDWDIEQNGLDYDVIRKAILDCVYFGSECKDEDILFPTLKTWQEEDYIEPCYAFFVVSWEEEERE